MLKGALHFPIKASLTSSIIRKYPREDLSGPPDSNHYRWVSVEFNVRISSVVEAASVFRFVQLFTWGERGGELGG